ncbi:galactokinase [Periweissella fabalis]|nr:galactokinase [Periweissella fabalis]
MKKQDLSQIITAFQTQFNTRPSDMFFSPGRVNLIGEHTDYNGGHVFPITLTLGTYGVARRRKDQLVRLYSLNFPELGVISFEISDTTKLPEHNWANFVKGVIKSLTELGYVIDYGFDLAIDGDIPIAAGLSSSASLELLIGVVIQRLFDFKIPRLQLVMAGHQAENDFIGVNTGLMDQFSVGFGAPNTAIFLDTNTLGYRLVPVILHDYEIIIMNTNKPRSLVTSKYNERVRETQQALQALQTELPIESLGDIDMTTFTSHQKLIKDPLLLKRARHAVSENQRTIKAVKQLAQGDLIEFGMLLNQSHASLRDDYDVTGIELDTLVTAAQEFPGVLGARMTGAGFGGCAIALVPKKSRARFEQQVGARFHQVVGYDASFYDVEIGPGAQWIGPVKD